MTVVSEVRTFRTARQLPFWIGTEVRMGDGNKLPGSLFQRLPPKVGNRRSIGGEHYRLYWQLYCRLIDWQ